MSRCFPSDLCSCLSSCLSQTLYLLELSCLAAFCKSESLQMSTLLQPVQCETQSRSFLLAPASEAGTEECVSPVFGKTLQHNSSSFSQASLYYCCCARLQTSQITIWIPVTPLERLAHYIITATFPYEDMTNQKFQPLFMVLRP